MSPPVVQVVDVRKHFKDVKAVDGVSLEIQKGEFVALLGPNGAGKTTLVEMIEGIQQPDQGEISINGLPWAGNEKHLHSIIGLSLQETNFYEKLTVRETLNLFGAFYKLKNNRTDELLELSNLTEKHKTFIKNLSGGQRQKLALCLALINKPEILLLDEPTTGLDPTARREIWEILKRLQREYNTAMILTSHYMEEASYLCERIIIIDKGKILAKGTLEELLAEHKNGEIIDFTSSRPIDKNALPQNGKVIMINLEDGALRGEIIVDDIIEYLPQFLKFVEENNIMLTSLECRKMTLDDLFITMTGRSLSE